MLRITLSRLKKVCSDAILPRILGGERCGGTPVCYAVIRKTPQRTKSTDEGKEDTTDKKSDAPNYTFVSGAELKPEDNFVRKGDEAAGLGENPEPKESSQPELSAKLPLTNREKCQRIIEKAFGKSDVTETDPVLSEQYFSHTVNLEHTRREIHESEKAKSKLQEQMHLDPLLPDDRTQYGIFKMSRELIKDDNQGTIIMKDSTLNAPPKAGGLELAERKDLEKTLNIHMTSAIEPDLNKNFENVKGTIEETLPLKEPNLTDAIEEVEKCVNNPESVEKKAACDHDAETIEMDIDERKLDLCQNVEPPTFQPHTAGIINATTAKETEEQLTQKLETIDETPVVEAQNPKIEGFNVTPRVLGEQAILGYKGTENNQENSHSVDLTFDEMAKRCMNSPLGQIDEMLLDEMENVGISTTRKTENKAPSTAVMEDDLVQMDILTKQPISTIEKQEIDSESPECEDTSEKITGFGKLVMTGPLGTIRDISCQTSQPDCNVQAEEINVRKSEEVVEQAEEENNLLYPDHIRIQLNPLLTRSYDLEEYNSADGCIATKLAYYYLPATHRTLEMNNQEIQNTSPSMETELNEVDVNEMKKHVLAETGPVQDLEKTTSNVTPEAPLSEEPQTVTAFSVGSPSEQCAPADAEVDNTSANVINLKIKSFDPPNDASDNIGNVGLLKPECNSYFKGVHRPSYYETMNASNSTANNQQTLDDTNSFHARNLSAAYVWSHQQQKASASIKKHVLREDEETDEIEQHGRTPSLQSTNEKEVVLEPRQTTANLSLYERVDTNLHLPDYKWDKNIEDLPQICKTTPPCSEDKLYSIEESQPKSEQVSGRTSIPEELLKQHELDPYYVLTCNETCPISPGSTMSTYENSDFVDTSETIYMKKNICESLRPKPSDMIMNCKTMPLERRSRLDEVDMQHKPEIMPTIESRPDAIEIPPSPGEQVALTELLRRVRRKSQLECRNKYKSMGVAVIPLEGKCNRKAPKCPPTAPRSPPLNPIPPPPMGLPMLKRRPPACKSRRKPSSHKCSACDMNVSCGVQFGDNSPGMAYELSEAEVCAIRSKVDLTEVVIEHLQTLGKIFGGVLRQVRSNVETLLARDFEPWSPIPSWPIPPKVEKDSKKSQPGIHGVPPCVTGCPISPKSRAEMNPEPPCNIKPCEGFPKRRSFSSLDCFAVSLGENKVYDLGNF